MSTTTKTSLRELLQADMPAIAVSFADEATDDLEEAKAAGLDVFELRIDRYRSYAPEHVLQQVRRFEDVPTIATIRTSGEGGEWAGSDDDRLNLFEAIIPYVDAVDIELASVTILQKVVQIAKSHDKVVIISNHNFAATPDANDLARMAHEAKGLGADFVKLSAMANSAEDLRTMASFTLANAELGLIVIAMGEHGTASRVFFQALGSRLTYAYSQAWPVSGQLTFRQTFEALRQFYPEFNQKKIIDLQIMEGI